MLCDVTKYSYSNKVQVLETISMTDLNALLDRVVFDDHQPGADTFETVESDSSFLRFICKSKKGFYEVLLDKTWRFHILKAGHISEDYFGIENRNEILMAAGFMGYDVMKQVAVA